MKVLTLTKKSEMIYEAFDQYFKGVKRLVQQMRLKVRGGFSSRYRAFSMIEFHAIRTILD